MEPNNQNGQQPQNGQLVAKPKTRIEVLKDIMKAPSIQEQFNNVLKDNADVFVASIIDLYNGDSYLQNCEPKQVVMEALKAAVLKLPINKSLGFAYIVPFGKAPTMIIGYKGLIQLAMRTGQYRIINADRVYEGEYKSMNKLTGEFNMDGEKTSDKIVGYFAYIEMLNGFSKTLYMTKEQIESYGKKYSKSYGNGPWQKEFDAMAIKTVLRILLSKYGFLSIDMAAALSSDIDSDTVYDDVNNNIRQKANKSNMSFDDADVVDDSKAKEQETEQEPAEVNPI
jgi:recombination protein RecT